MASDLIKATAQTIFDCGKCLNCRRKHARQLAIRCVLHASCYQHNSFLTLTYDPSIEGFNNKLDYRHIQLFKKSLRKHAEKTGRKLEIFNVHEYGKNGQKHWHLIVFNYDFSNETDKNGKHVPREVHTVKNGLPLYTHKELERLWPYGFSTIGDVSEGTAMYQAQYTQKDIKNGNTNSDKKSKSNHSGIGKAYFLKHYEQILSLGYIPYNNAKTPLPRYFEKLAHRHYCHYFDQTYFFDTRERKRRYTPFNGENKKNGDLPNKRIADLWLQYLVRKQQFIDEKQEEWNQTVDSYLETKTDPDFKKSGDNALYDLKNKNKQEKF